MNDDMRPSHTTEFVGLTDEQKLATAYWAEAGQYDLDDLRATVAGWLADAWDDGNRHDDWSLVNTCETPGNCTPDHNPYRNIRDAEVAFDTRTESAPMSGTYQIDGTTARLIRDGESSDD